MDSIIFHSAILPPAGRVKDLGCPVNREKVFWGFGGELSSPAEVALVNTFILFFHRHPHVHL